MTERVTLRGELAAFFNTAYEWFESDEVFGAALETYLQIYGNFYVIPRVSATISTSAEAKDGNESIDSRKSISGSVNLYYLF